MAQAIKSLPSHDSYFCENQKWQQDPLSSDSLVSTDPVSKVREKALPSATAPTSSDSTLSEHAISLGSSSLDGQRRVIKNVSDKKEILDSKCKEFLDSINHLESQYAFYIGHADWLDHLRDEGFDQFKVQKDYAERSSILLEEFAPKDYESLFASPYAGKLGKFFEVIKSGIKVLNPCASLATKIFQLVMLRVLQYKLDQIKKQGNASSPDCQKRIAEIQNKFLNKKQDLNLALKKPSLKISKWGSCQFLVNPLSYVIKLDPNSKLNATVIRNCIKGSFRLFKNIVDWQVACQNRQLHNKYKARIEAPILTKEDIELQRIQEVSQKMEAIRPKVQAFLINSVFQDYAVIQKQLADEGVILSSDYTSRKFPSTKSEWNARVFMLNSKSPEEAELARTEFEDPLCCLFARAKAEREEKEETRAKMLVKAYETLESIKHNQEQDLLCLQQYEAIAAFALTLIQTLLCIPYLSVQYPFQFLKTLSSDLGIPHSIINFSSVFLPDLDITLAGLLALGVTGLIKKIYLQPESFSLNYYHLELKKSWVEYIHVLYDYLYSLKKAMIQINILTTQVIMERNFSFSTATNPRILDINAKIEQNTQDKTSRVAELKQELQELSLQDLNHRINSYNGDYIADFSSEIAKTHLDTLPELSVQSFQKKSGITIQGESQGKVANSILDAIAADLDTRMKNVYSQLS